MKLKIDADRIAVLEQIEMIINDLIEDGCFNEERYCVKVIKEAKEAWYLVDQLSYKVHNFSVYETDLEGMQHAYQALSEMNGKVVAEVNEDVMKTVAEYLYDFDKLRYGVCDLTYEVLLESLIWGGFKTEFIAKHAAEFDAKYDGMPLDEIEADLKIKALELYEFLETADQYIDQRGAPSANTAEYKEYIRGRLEDLASELGCVFLISQFATMTQAYCEHYALYADVA